VNNNHKVDIERVETLYDQAGLNTNAEVSFLDMYGNLVLKQTTYSAHALGQPANTQSNVIYDVNIAAMNPIVRELTLHAEAYTGSAFGAEPALLEHDVSKDDWRLYQDPSLRVACALVALDFGPWAAAHLFQNNVN